MSQRVRLTILMAALVALVALNSLHGQVRVRPTPFQQPPSVTAGTGDGVTLVTSGVPRLLTTAITVGPDQWDSNGLTHDFTIATLPAKTRLFDVVADVTAAFSCAAVCTSTTLSMVVGKGSGGAEYLDSFDADAAIAVFGDADAERGASLDGVVNGEVPNWASTQAVVARLTSGTGNLGDGTDTNLATGTVTFYLTYAVYP